MPGLGITSKYDITHFIEDYMPGLGICQSLASQVSMIYYTL